MLTATCHPTSHTHLTPPLYYKLSAHQLKTMYTSYSKASEKNFIVSTEPPSSDTPSIRLNETRSRTQGLEPSFVNFRESRFSGNPGKFPIFGKPGNFSRFSGIPGFILVGIPESRDFKLRSGMTSLVPYRTLFGRT